MNVDPWRSEMSNSDHEKHVSVTARAHDQEHSRERVTSGNKARAANHDAERVEAKRVEKMQAHSSSHRTAGTAKTPKQ